LKYLNDALVQFFNLIHSGVASVIVNKNYSYGVAIILVTAIIRILLIPLSSKQTKSTLKMNELQPESQKIQARYKNDPQKSQEELMKLYREKGVNPLGGCLPLLIQWPILIALYYVFNTLQGINGVSFLWIKDLAGTANLRDFTTWILPILSGLTTYYTGVIMSPPSSSNQSQQVSTMNMGMSIFLVIMSWNFKAALVLYWVTTNIFQIGQTLVFKKIYEKRQANV
jgi:YidC/Oxa1 family membrane protein insertase